MWPRSLFGEKPVRCRSLEANGDTPLCQSQVSQVTRANKPREGGTFEG